MEYLIIRLDSIDLYGDSNDLNDAADDGWRLIAVTHREACDVAYLEREKTWQKSS